MSTLFEITGDDISLLDDADLRALIGLLCEADYRSAALPTSWIIWGGHQDARDGGLDVVVRGETGPPGNSFVPKKITGFQVKKPDMPRAAILKEMRPDGMLREEIRTLIQECGAYIIACSSGSTTNSALKNRIDAMREAITSESGNQNLHVDFLDRGRIASWVRTHPALILWVRNRIGRQLSGWRPFENWAYAPGGLEEEYLLDEGLRLHNGAKRSNDGMSIEDGLINLRSALSTPGTSVRLAGLSGVGKTRLVQALFDERIGKQPLNRSQVFYADISDSPDPDPKNFAEQLIANRTRAILIVDNCPPDLHRRLTQVCAEPRSTVSLLTVEYDIRDDIPEETSVFRLEPASEELIDKLVRTRFPHISQVDSKTIANFAGGNARVAIALANTVQHGETLSGFRDEELFERLFWQRHDSSENLLKSAEVCSLVYSFEGTEIDTQASELNFLASLVNSSGSELYRDVNVLKERGLVQSRHVWRAVLPHAIANRLAKRALNSLPQSKVSQSFLGSGSERLIKSFSRRLSYLHDCTPAVQIVEEWLAHDGWLGKENCNFNAFGMEVFKNIAPVSPSIVLEAIERAANRDDGLCFTSREHRHYNEFVRILRHLAYDPALFDRSVTLICRYALSEKPEENNNSIRELLKSLFYIYLSGTHASVEARAKIVENLVDSDDQSQQQLGLFLLDTALEAWHFSSSYEFDFGARSRDYGYRPKSHEDIIHWYEPFITICTRLALSKQAVAQKARKLLANNLRGLWTKAGMFDALENSTKQIHGQQPWNEGWIAARGIVRYDSKSFPEDIQERLKNFENLLRPDDLLERARTFALTDNHHSFDLVDTIEDDRDPSSGWNRIEETTRQIGVQVANNSEVLDALLPELVSTHNIRLQSFGRGLAAGRADKNDVWKLLYTQLQKTTPEKRQIGVFMGYLAGCAEEAPEFYASTLDGLVNDDVLGEWFPILQTSSTIDSRGVERLHEALNLGKAEIYAFQYLAWGRAHESIADDDLAKLLWKILAVEDGIGVAIEIIHMRFHRENHNTHKYSEELIKVARHILSSYSFPDERKRKSKQDYELTSIAKSCLVGADAEDSAAILCQHIAEAIVDNRVYAFDYPELLSTVASAQPFVFLDTFGGNDNIEDYHRRRMFSDSVEKQNNPLNQIPDGIIISWCDKDPEKRYPIIASVIQGFNETSDECGFEWKPIVNLILDKAPVVITVLDSLAASISPKSWSGSYADILQKRSVLLKILYEHSNEEIRAWARNKFSALQEIIKGERECEELRRNRHKDESFE